MDKLKKILILGYLFIAITGGLALLPTLVESATSPPTQGKELRDCPDVCPVLVTVPSGTYEMGSTLAHPMNSKDEALHKVTISKPFAIGKYDVTFAEWEACVAEKGCKTKPSDHGWGRGTRPVIEVSWFDAQEYVRWLTRKTGKRYRLPSEAEWEYAAHGNTQTTFYWGEAASHQFANYGADNCCSGLVAGADKWLNTSPVGSFPPNRFGLYDMSGNVIQWVADCWNDSYSGAPDDGSAWLSGDCNKRVLRGGSWGANPFFIRVANRNWSPADFHDMYVGFRVVRAL